MNLDMAKIDAVADQLTILRKTDIAPSATVSNINASPKFTIPGILSFEKYEKGGFLAKNIILLICYTN